ncbi:glycosyltransferase [Arthrobacter sp. 24S4-2]|uniref:glycosyltransferase n=1 Tax=Arthrobacter sp. 24S4-2 TaxID=2575374 RepID=UPI0010C7ABA9|nr:glycosyltransferase [Arthrobacter sp. 24S4-2]QCO99610.1 glycosyltransferase [Arthrobacter sp. 24S4-2]
MKVVFALRADAFTKPGGDSKKVERYRTGLNLLGWESEVVTSARELLATPSDIVHLMNLDTPRENMHYASIAERSGRPFVISTIRHPFDGMLSMYEFGHDRFYRQLGRLGIEAETGIGFREQVKLLKQKNVPAALIRGTYRSLQRQLVKKASIVFPMATGEANAIRSDLDAGTKQKIIRNGFSFSPTAGSDSRPVTDFDLVSVGRIEPRKNSLMLAQAAAGTGLRTAFVGSLNTNHKAYADNFLQQIAEHENLEYLGSKDHNEIMGILQRCDVYINPAWFEVVSQADVEAACMGLRIVSTRHSYLEDALGTEVQRFDPIGLLGSGASDRLLELFDVATKVSGAANRDWGECSVELDAAYREVLRVA